MQIMGFCEILIFHIFYCLAYSTLLVKAGFVAIQFLPHIVFAEFIENEDHITQRG